MVCLRSSSWVLIRVFVKDLYFFVLDKPRQDNLIREWNEAGARVKINSGGFIVGAILAAIPGTGADGGMQIRRAPQSEDESSPVRDGKALRIKTTFT